MGKRKSASTRKDFETRVAYLDKFTEGETERLDKLRQDLEDSVKRTERIKNVFVKHLTEAGAHCNRAKSFVNLLSDFQVHTEIQKELIDRNITSILSGKSKKRRLPECENCKK
jgi:hypothetical protein